MYFPKNSGNVTTDVRSVIRRLYGEKDILRNALLFRLFICLHIKYLVLVDDKVGVFLLQVEKEGCKFSEQDGEECTRYAEYYRDEER